MLIWVWNFNIVGEIKSALKDAEKAVVLDSKNPVSFNLLTPLKYNSC